MVSLRQPNCGAMFRGMQTEPISPVNTPHPSLRIGDRAPNFRARSTLGDVSLADYRGRWLMFFSHPGDFTPVCTSEFVAIARAADRFAAMDCALLGLSVDSLYSHLAWVRSIRDSFGVTVPFPIVEDPSMAIGRAYGMIDETARDASSIRSTYFINPEGIIRSIVWYPANVGRSVEELLRLLAALRQTEDGSVMSPEGWRPGDALLMSPVQTQAEVLAETRPEQPWFCRKAEK